MVPPPPLQPNHFAEPKTSRQMLGAAKAEIRRRQSDGSWFSGTSAVGQIMKLVPNLLGRVSVEPAVPLPGGGYEPIPAKRRRRAAIGKAVGSANKKPKLTPEEKLAARNEQKRLREAARAKEKDEKEAARLEKRHQRKMEAIEIDAAKRATLIANKKWAPSIHLSACPQTRAPRRPPPRPQLPPPPPSSPPPPRRVHAVGKARAP